MFQAVMSVKSLEILLSLGLSGRFLLDTLQPRKNQTNRATDIG